MTLEKRLVVSPEEIKGIIVECKGCAARLTAKFQVPVATPGRCPQCGAEWLFSTDDPARAFAKVLQGLTRVNSSEQYPYRVFLDLEAPAQ